VTEPSHGSIIRTRSRCLPGRLRLHWFVLAEGNDGNGSPLSGAPAEGLLNIKWFAGRAARAPVRDPRRRAAPALRPPPSTFMQVEGEINIAPVDYGLTGRLTWAPGHSAADLAFPLPIGRPVGSADGGPTRMTPVGLAVRRGAIEAGACTASLPLDGELELHNRGPLALRLRLRATAGVRLVNPDAGLVLDPGQVLRLPVQRRHTMVVDRLVDYLDLAVTCTAEPLALLSGTEPRGRRSAGTPIELRLATDVRANPCADGQTYCLPSASLVRLDLDSWMEPGSWGLPVPARGDRPVQVWAGPGGDAGRRLRATLLPAASGKNAQPTAEAPGPTPDPAEPPPSMGQVSLWAQPVELLKWFIGPLDDLSGRIEILHEDGPTNGLAVAYDVRAAIRGLICAQRHLEIVADAGQVFSFPLDLLISARADVQAPIRPRWAWRGPPGPYPMLCALSLVKASPAGAMTTNPSDGKDAHESDATVLTPKVERLPDAVLSANLGRVFPTVLRVTPQDACGWEEDSWEASLVLLNGAGRTIDEVGIRYTTRPVLPIIALTLHRPPSSPQDLAVRFTVANPNELRALRLDACRVTARLKSIGFPWIGLQAAFEGPAPSGGVIRPAQARTFTAQLRAIAPLAGLLTRLARRLDVEVVLEASLVPATDAPAITREPDLVSREFTARRHFDLRRDWDGH
jgi:hypothetical protein